VAVSKTFQQHSSGTVSSAISQSALHGTRKLSRVEVPCEILWLSSCHNIWCDITLWLYVGCFPFYLCV